jgi:predicted DNA-binding ribbon-helix-helix protein
VSEWLIFSSNRFVGRAFILSDKGVVEMTRRGSAVIKRSIDREGHRSSVSLENEFWDALWEIAGSKNVTVSALVATIDHGANRDNLSSAIRVFVLDHYRRSSEPTPAGQPNQTPLPQGQPHREVP